VYNVSEKNRSNSTTTIPVLPSFLNTLNSFVERSVLLNFRWNIFERMAKLCEKINVSTETAWQRLTCPVSYSFLCMRENSATFSFPSDKVECGAQSEQRISMCDVTCALFCISATTRNVAQCIQQWHSSKTTIWSWAQKYKNHLLWRSKGHIISSWWWYKEHRNVLQKHSKLM